MAEHVEHTTDVDGMLDRMTPELFDEWAAKDLIEPVGYQSQMLGLIAWMMHAWLGTSESSTKPEHFMPWQQYHQHKEHDNHAARQLLDRALRR